VQLEVDGRTVFAATGGRPFDAAHPAVLFLHGAGMDHTVWSQQSRYAAHHERAVLAVDLPGHGRSDGPALPSVPELVDWVVRLLDAAGLERAALVGHSMGGLVALAAAAASPARVAALALLGIAARMPVHPDLLAAARADDHLAPELIVSWGYGPAGRVGGQPAPGLWLAGGGMRLLERAGQGVLATDLAACDAYDGAEEAAARVACPTLFLLGAEDRMAPPAKVRSLVKAIPGADSVILADTGHMMMVEQPEAVTAALSRFLSSAANEKSRAEEAPPGSG
jgi:pimeloyl-ACP methyl ester carboxylesterase